MSRTAENDGEAPGRRSAAPGAGELLALAAAPVFAVMAIVTEVSARSGMEMHGNGAHGSPIGEMTTMYLLMAIFHAAPWLRRMGRGAAGHVGRV